MSDKIIIISILWITTTISCFGKDCFWISLIMALSSIFITHHLLDFKI